MWLFDDRTVPDIRTPLPGPNGGGAARARQASTSRRRTRRVYPLVVERGSGAVIEDVDGNLFLDFTAGIAVTATGHCHPEVVAAIQDQADKLLHMSGTDFYYRPQIDLAERLAKVAPGPSPKKVFFTNSGAEALEAALKLARWHTGRNRVVAFFGAFHGRTYGAMSLSGSKLVHRRGFSPLVPDIHHVAFPRTCPRAAAAEQCRIDREIEETLFKRIAPAGGGGRDLRRADPGRGRLPPARRRAACRRCGSCATSTASCSSSTRCSPAWAAPARCSPSSTGASSRTSSAARRASPAGCRSGRSSPRRRDGLAAAAATPAPSAATRSAAGPRSPRSTCSNASTWPTPPTRGEQLRAGLRELATKHAGSAGRPRPGADDRGRSARRRRALREKVIQAAFHRGLLLLGCGETAHPLLPAAVHHGRAGRRLPAHPRRRAGGGRTGAGRRSPSASDGWNGAGPT